MVFFEGDDSTYVDGKMRIHGTGSEDYYNGGWYDLPGKWNCAKSLPIHGCLDYHYKQHVPEDFAFIQQTSFPLKKNFIWE